MKLRTDGLENFIRDNAPDKFFGVTFTKRTTGEVRNMTCRLGVRKYLKGGPVAYNPQEHKLLWVYDVEKKGYRSIPLDAVKEVRIAGLKIEVVKND